MVGRSPDCNVLCHDPGVADRQAVLYFDGTHLRVQALAPPWPFIDGQPISDAMLAGGQQLRLGQSIWQLVGSGSSGTVFDFVNRLGESLSDAAGLEAPREWNAREMFADVARHHADNEIESFFTVGTPATTPPISAIDARWPKPWVFGRVFLMTLALYVGFVLAWKYFENPNLVPGLLMVGTVAVPASLLIFFFEMNVARNISLYQVIKLLLIGGLTSLVVSLFFYQWTHLSSWIGATAAGIIEETGKGLTLLLVVRQMRYRWTLNGLLLGATVGTGFAIFESAGYALRIGFSDGIAAMRDVIMLRGGLSLVGGHVLWTGLVGGALWRVKAGRPFHPRMLTDPRFLRVFFICVVMHMVWNSPLPSPLFVKHVVLGVVAWILVLGMIQAGLREVRTAQASNPSGVRPAA